MGAPSSGDDDSVYSAPSVTASSTADGDAPKSSPAATTTTTNCRKEVVERLELLVDAAQHGPASASMLLPERRRAGGG